MALAIQMLFGRFLSDTNTQWNLPGIQSSRGFISQMISHLSQHAAESPRRCFRRTQNGDFVEEDRVFGYVDVGAKVSVGCHCELLVFDFERMAIKIDYMTRRLAELAGFYTFVIGDSARTGNQPVFRPN